MVRVGVVHRSRTVPRVSVRTRQACWSGRRMRDATTRSFEVSDASARPRSRAASARCTGCSAPPVTRLELRRDGRRAGMCRGPHLRARVLEGRAGAAVTSTDIGRDPRRGTGFWIIHEQLDLLAGLRLAASSNCA